MVRNALFCTNCSIQICSSMAPHWHFRPDLLDIVVINLSGADICSLVTLSNYTPPGVHYLEAPHLMSHSTILEMLIQRR